jgi:hypothetical protein
MSLASLTAEVDARVWTDRNTVLARAIDALSLVKIKSINRIVGRASMTLAGSSHGYFKPDIPDYQKYLFEYVRLKRQLGLYRRNLVNEHVSEANLSSIADRIKSLESEVRLAREEARRLRFGQYSARALDGRTGVQNMGLHGHLW